MGTLVGLKVILSKGLCTRFFLEPAEDFCSAPITPVSALVPLPPEWAEKELEGVERRWEGRLGKGGAFRPTHCTPTTKMAIVIPYR